MKLPREVSIGPTRLRAQQGELENTLRVQEAQQRLVNTLGSAAITYQVARDRNRLAAALSASTEGYEAMAAYVSDKKAFDLNNDQFIPKELRAQIANNFQLNLQDITDEEGKAFVPAHEVRGLIHDYHAKKITDKGRSFLKGDKLLQSKFDQTLNARKSKVVAQITSLNVQEQTEQYAAMGNYAYEQAVRNGDMLEATNVIEDMAEAGLWGPEKVADHMANVIGDVQYHTRINKLAVGTYTDAQNVLNNLDAPDLNMKSDQVFDVYNKAVGIIQRKENEFKDARKKQSALVLGDNLIKLGEDGVLTWDYLRSLKGQMEPSDYKQLINAARAALNTDGGAARDNQELTRKISVMIGRLSIPDASVPFAQRKGHVINMLHEAMGYDPAIGDYTGAPQLRRETYFALLDQVNKSDQRVINDPRVNLLIDRVYKQLTGGTRGAAFAEEVTASMLAAIDYESDIIKAALDAGPGFDAQAWHNKNIEKYKSPILQENYAIMLTNRIASFAVAKPGRTTDALDPYTLHIDLDITATKEALKEKIKQGIYDDEEAAELFNLLEKAERMSTP